MQPLTKVPAGSDIFIDANIFVYGLNGVSAQCLRLLERCSREEAIGISLFEIVNAATHVFMLGEARSKSLIAPPGSARQLRQKSQVIPALIDYWRETGRILSLNLLLLSTNEAMVRSAQPERQKAHLLTNDSMIVSCMRDMESNALPLPAAISTARSASVFLDPMIFDAR